MKRRTTDGRLKVAVICPQAAVVTQYGLCYETKWTELRLRVEHAPSGLKSAQFLGGMYMVALCEILDWDSAHFRRRIARVKSDRLTANHVSEVLEWCRGNEVACLYFLADAHDVETILTAEAIGFGMKDIRLTYERRLDPEFAPTQSLPPDVRVRPASSSDIPYLEAIARDSYTDSRFYFDHHFEREAVTRMYQLWVRQSVEGMADVVLVLERQGRACGFITCHLLKQGLGQCQLGGLAADLRGQGLGVRLYETALEWLGRHHVERVIYITQGRNLRAQRLFQRLGFHSRAVQIWYHKWFDEAGADVRIVAAP
jgi:ribosomal protein S18 acetylase RimI-like enzyme